MIRNNLYTIKDFAPSDLVQKMWHKSDASWEMIHVVTAIPCLCSSNIHPRRISSRGINISGQPQCIFLVLDEACLGTQSNCFSYQWWYWLIMLNCLQASSNEPFNTQQLSIWAITHAYTWAWNFSCDSAFP